MDSGEPIVNRPVRAAQRQDVEEALARGSAVVVDVLEDESYCRNHIPGAWPLPLSELPRRARTLLRDPGRPIIVYCGGYG